MPYSSFPFSTNPRDFQDDTVINKVLDMDVPKLSNLFDSNFLNVYHK